MDQNRPFIPSPKTADTLEHKLEDFSCLLDLLFSEILELQNFNNAGMCSAYVSDWAIKQAILVERIEKEFNHLFKFAMGDSTKGGDYES